MTSLDALIALVVALAAVTGFRTGLLGGLWGIVSWGLGLLVADAAALRLAPAIAPSLGIAAFAAPALAFAAALVVAELLLALAGRLVVAPLRALVRANGISGALDRALGVAPGVARGFLLCAVLLAVARALWHDAALRAAIDGSTVARALIAAVDVARSLLSPSVSR